VVEVSEVGRVFRRPEHREASREGRRGHEKRDKYTCGILYRAMDNRWF
jgi:hypothetical protein